jgi:hypothetical protein
VGQVVAEQPAADAQTPPWHVSPVPQLMQLAAPRPHAASVLPSWQTLFRQHPEQVVLSQPTALH